MAVNVRSTHTAVCDGLSRNELLAWVNDTLKSNFTKVDELCTGAAYCQLIHSLFPSQVPIKRIKFYTNIEREFFDNFKILQTAFQRLRVDKVIPIDRLCRGKFQDNIEFLQWFKKFYDANYQTTIYDPVAARNGLPMGYGALSLKRNSEKRSKPVLPTWDKPTEKDEPVVEVAEPTPSTGSSSETGLTLKRSLTRTEFKKLPAKTERVNSLGRIDAINAINHNTMDQGSQKVQTKANEFYRQRIEQIEQLLLKRERETNELKIKLIKMKIFEDNRTELLRRLQGIIMDGGEVEDVLELKTEISKILKEFGEIDENDSNGCLNKFSGNICREDYAKYSENCAEGGEENCDADCEVDDKEIYVDANEIDFEENKLEKDDLGNGNETVLNKI